MKLPRRKFLHLAASAAALPALPRVASALVYPTRPVHIILGLPAGGTPDLFARLIGEWLSERLGQSFVIENRPGAATNIATDLVAKAPPDGYTLLMVTTPNLINATLYPDLKFNFIRDIAPVASIGGVPFIMVVNPSFPAKTVPEFIAYAKSHPSQINVASSGTGNLTYMAAELFKMIAGVDMVQVPARGEASAYSDLLSGRVQVVFGPIPSLIGYAQAGKVRALLDGRYNVSFEDLRRVYLAGLRHRVLLNFEAQAEGIDPDEVLLKVLENVPEKAEERAVA